MTAARVPTPRPLAAVMHSGEGQQDGLTSASPNAACKLSFQRWDYLCPHSLGHLTD